VGQFPVDEVSEIIILQYFDTVRCVSWWICSPIFGS